MKKELTKLREFMNNEVRDDSVHHALVEFLKMFELMDLRLERNEAWMQQQTAARDYKAIGGKPVARK